MVGSLETSGLRGTPSERKGWQEAENSLVEDRGRTSEVGRGTFCLFFFLILVAVLSLHGYAWLSLVAMSAGYSLVVILGLLSVVASLVAELGLQTQGLQ